MKLVLLTSLAVELWRKNRHIVVVHAGVFIFVLSFLRKYSQCSPTYSSKKPSLIFFLMILVCFYLFKSVDIIVLIPSDFGPNTVQSYCIVLYHICFVFACLSGSHFHIASTNLVFLTQTWKHLVNILLLVLSSCFHPVECFCLSVSLYNG